MMRYDCLLISGTFIVARPTGHVWSERERDEFSLVQVDLLPDPYDREIRVGDATVMASAIDPALVEGAE